MQPTDKLSPHFAVWELACRHCGRLPDGGISQELLDRLEVLRVRVGRPVHITSGYRCPEYNRQVGGAENSQHLYGTGADLYVDGLDNQAMILHAHAAGFTGLGLYDRHIHVDVRPELAAWDNRGQA